MRRLVSEGPPHALGPWLLGAIVLVAAALQPLGRAAASEHVAADEDVPALEEATPVDDAPPADDTPPTDDAPPADDDVRAADHDDDVPPADEAPTDDSVRPGLLDAGHAYASAGVRGLGAWIDGFFAAENYEAELNESRVRVRIDSFSDRYEGTDVDAKARLHLKLPALDDRLRVEVLSAGEAEEDTTTTDAPVEPAGSDLSLDSITAALSYFFRNDEQRSVRARVGLDFDGYEPNPFVGLRYREQFELNEDWNFRFVQRFRYFSLDGLESRTTLGLDRVLPEDMLFRWEIDGTWLEEQPNYLYSVNFSVFQPLDAKSAVEYQLLNSFLTDPHRLDRVTVRFRYRRQVWREWLFLEAAPQLAMPRIRDFEPVPGILLRVEMTFGG